MPGHTAIINVLVLRENNGASNAWPGIETELTLPPHGCEDEVAGTWLVEQGFVALIDGEWEFYSPGEAVNLFSTWNTDEVEWHAAIRLTCTNLGNTWLLNNNYIDVLHALSVCCDISTVKTNIFAFKQSIYSLDPNDPNPPCGTEAIFKWLALFGTNEDRELFYTFEVSLVSHDVSVVLQDVFLGHELQPLTASVQLVMAWPSDFIGLQLGPKTLVDNNVVPGPNEVRIDTFDNGTIKVLGSIFKNGQFGLEQIKSANKEFRLPGTWCNQFSCSALIVNFTPERPHTNYVVHLLNQANNEVAATTVNGGQTQVLGPITGGIYRICLEIIEDDGGVRTDIVSSFQEVLVYGTHGNCGNGQLYTLNEITCELTVKEGFG